MLSPVEGPLQPTGWDFPQPMSKGLEYEKGKGLIVVPAYVGSLAEANKAPVTKLIRAREQKNTKVRRKEKRKQAAKNTPTSKKEKRVRGSPTVAR
eukprot:1144025-Pelagomonas_calceolata.AAC.5